MQFPLQDGRRFIITGANSGVGYQAALELGRLGAEIDFAVRDTSKGSAAVESIRRELPSLRATVSSLDLASLDSVREFAARELNNGKRLDVLINNAGMINEGERRTTKDGFELMFGTNALGPFALTGLLLPKLLERGTVGGADVPPRIVTLASVAHKRGTIPFDDLQGDRTYRKGYPWYTLSKLANLMLALEMDRRLRGQHPGAHGEPAVWSVACHPGVANTNFFKTNASGKIEAAIRRLSGHVISAVLNSDKEGALPTVFAAVSPEAKSGGYYGPQGFKEMRGGDVGPAEIAPQARDQAAAARLWSECERLAGTRYLDGTRDTGAGELR